MQVKGTTVQKLKYKFLQILIKLSIIMTKAKMFLINIYKCIIFFI